MFSQGHSSVGLLTLIISVVWAGEPGKGMGRLCTNLVCNVLQITVLVSELRKNVGKTMWEKAAGYIYL